MAEAQGLGEDQDGASRGSDGRWEGDNEDHIRGHRQGKEHRALRRRWPLTERG